MLCARSVHHQRALGGDALLLSRARFRFQQCSLLLKQLYAWSSCLCAPTAPCQLQSAPTGQVLACHESCCGLQMMAGGDPAREGKGGEDGKVRRHLHLPLSTVLAAAFQGLAGTVLAAAAWELRKTSHAQGLGACASGHVSTVFSASPPWGIAQLEHYMWVQRRSHLSTPTWPAAAQCKNAKCFCTTKIDCSLLVWASHALKSGQLSGLLMTQHDRAQDGTLMSLHQLSRACSQLPLRHVNLSQHTANVASGGRVGNTCNPRHDCTCCRLHSWHVPTCSLCGACRRAAAAAPLGRPLLQTTLSRSWI